MSSSMRHQALSALLFLYRQFFRVHPDTFVDIVRAKRGKTLPAVLPQQEVRALLSNLSEIVQLVAYFLYGSGAQALD